MNDIDDRADAFVFWTAIGAALWTIFALLMGWIP